MRRGSSIGAGLVLAAALGRGVPGCGTSSFVCEGDESCAGLVEGRCEPDGYCSIPDDGCDSGRRYATHSGALSGHCVDVEATGTGTTAVGESEGQPTSADDGSTTTPPATTGSDSTGSDSTGGPEAKACEIETVVDEPFTALPLDPSRWMVTNDEGIAVNVLDDELRLSAIDATAAYAELDSAFLLPSSGSLGVELVAVPPLDAPAEAYVVLTDFESSYGFLASGGQLELFYEERFESPLVTSLTHDPVAHRWLRLVFDASDDRLAWEAAPAVGEWVLLEETELAIGFDPGESWFVLGGGVWEGPITAEPLAAFGHAFVCRD